MILVIVGSLHLHFDRLLKKMDEIAPVLNEKVVMQTGSSDYEPKNVEWFHFESEERIEELYDECDIIVCHAGAGTILNGLIRDKPVVMVPRRKMYNEVTNDHQLMLASKIESMGRGITVLDVEELESAVRQALKESLMPFEKDRSLVDYLSGRLASFDN